jgi:Mrp family chromosome partitioning ATPase
MGLDRDYANMQENYQDLLSKRLNARIAENLEKRQKGERFRILDPANLPSMPEGPERLLIVLAGLVIGLGLGCGLAFVIEQWNLTFRRSEDAEVSLGFPILATIPSFQLAYGKSSDGLLLGGSFGATSDGSSDSELANGELMANASGVGKWKGGATPDPSLVSRWRPNSIVAEQYRVAATRLVLMNDDRANTVVLATSAMKGEGKTSSVVNLGYTLARDLEKQVLLIGCDFKAPHLHKGLGMAAAPGLADYFHGNVGLENCIHRMDDVPLWVLPAGAVEEHAVSLSRLPQLASLIESLRSRFDYIVLDAPPILPLADMNVLAGLADVLILVVRAGVTPQEIVVKAMDMLRPTVQARILLTDASSQGMPYFMPQEVYGAPYTQAREHV